MKWQRFLNLLPEQRRIDVRGYRFVFLRVDFCASDGHWLAIGPILKGGVYAQGIRACLPIGNFVVYRRAP